MTRERRDILFLLTLAAVVRVPGLDTGLWFDEIQMCVELLSRSFSDLLTAYPSDNNHPGYTWAAWASTRLLGDAPWAVRLPAFVAGVLAPLALYRFILRVDRRGTAFAASVLLALSSHTVMFSQNARGYSALLLLTILATDAYQKLLTEKDRSARAPYAVWMGLATWVHTTAVFVALGHALVALPGSLRRKRLEPLASLAFAGLVSLLLHAPILRPMWRFFSAAKTGRGDWDWTRPFWTLQESLRSFGVPLWALVPVVLAGLVTFVLGLRRLARRDPRLPALLFLPPALGGTFLVLSGRNLWPRFFFFATGFLLWVAVAGIDAIAHGTARAVRRPHIAPWVRRLAFVLMGIVLAWRLPAVWTLPKQDYEGALSVVRERATGGDLIVAAGLAVLPYQAYYDDDIPEVTGHNVGDLLSSLPAGRALWILTTFPVFTDSRDPELARWLSTKAQLVERRPGLIGDGDLLIYRASSPSGR